MPAAGWRRGLFLAHQAARKVFDLVGKVFLLLVGEFHVFEGIGGRGDEMLDVAVAFGGGELGHEVAVGGELREDGGNVGVACQFADLVCNVLVAKNFIENTHNDVCLVLHGKDTHFSRTGEKKQLTVPTLIWHGMWNVKNEE